MSNRATPSRSFNTVKHSNREQRVKRHQQGRMVLLSIFLVIIAILLSLLILIIGSIADVIGSNIPDLPPNQDGQENQTPQTGSILYTQITKARDDVNKGELLLVNADHAYVFPTGNAHLINIYDNRTKISGSNIYQVSYDTYLLQKDAFRAFDTMMQKYYEISEGDGSVLISSAYRTLKDQEDLGSSVQAGYSDHHTGYCVALKKFNASNVIGTIEKDHWIYQNAHKYGFVVRYPDSKVDETGVSDYEHCFRYVGVAHATYMYEKDLCLEEYVALLQKSYTTEHLKITGTDKNQYEVYYISAGSGDIATLDVPSNYKYTISGDNMGGFIVTVNLSQPVQGE